jgi:hypothetical protein
MPVKKCHPFTLIAGSASMTSVAKTNTNASSGTTALNRPAHRTVRP